MRLKKHGLNHIVANTNDLFGSLKLKPNTNLIYLGDFKLKSSAPAQCLTFDYVGGTVMDYFSCEQCGTNWICKPCAEYCHKGHTLLPYLQNKATTWACCYCYKNKFCKALNKDSKK